MCSVDNALIVDKTYKSRDGNSAALRLWLALSTIFSKMLRSYPTASIVPEEITELLIDWNHGSPEALEKLLPLVETELHRIARNYMRRENPGHTLQTTALVNEAYLKLVGQREVRWQNRAHFFALASQIMRRILLDHARAQGRAKRGGDALHVNLDDVAVVSPEKSDELIALDEALTRLAEFDPRKSKIVEMRFFGGLSVNEVAEVLNIAPVTVMLHWRLAKAWLQKELRALTFSQD
jgi:RNA polymerase sigma factor (TIGR02999 family)